LIIPFIKFYIASISTSVILDSRNEIKLLVTNLRIKN